jgi:hypothetical protein
MFLAGMHRKQVPAKHSLGSNFDDAFQIVLPDLASGEFSIILEKLTA